ncbi:MAG TPA: HD domain-containing protein [Saprospiraceae bacterium]|nr:HD domain-containing protein [Saprospiraceae bacterium]
MNKRKLINDPVYGLIHIRTPLLFDLIEHPLFQRLRRIKQTGLTHLVYPGAQHTRFHHALGAMHLMGMAIDELRSKQTEITPQEEEAALIAVLLHDIGHSPYSHALEGLLVQADHESIGKLLIGHLQKTLDPGIGLALEMFEGLYHRPFFHQLISGQLDLDRLDYLSRDSFYTGVAEGVVGHDRILRMLQVVDDKLVVEEKGLHSIEKFLVARRIMYWQVYLHKTVLSAELMAKHIIRLLREEKSLTRAPFLASELEYFFSNKVDLEHFKKDFDEIIPYFLALDDISIDYSIKRLTSYPSQSIAFLTSNLVNRKLHKIQWSGEPIDEHIVQDMIRKTAHLYGWSEEDARKLVWSGSESNSIYNRDIDEIQILTKDEEIKPFSSFLETPISIALNRKYFICYPGKSKSGNQAGKG